MATCHASYFRQCGHSVTIYIVRHSQCPSALTQHQMFSSSLPWYQPLPVLYVVVAVPLASINGDECGVYSRMATILLRSSLS